MKNIPILQQPRAVGANPDLTGFDLDLWSRFYVLLIKKLPLKHIRAIPFKCVLGRDDKHKIFGPPPLFLLE